MSSDIFEFWADCSPSDRTHPLDRPVFDRPFVGNMGFDLRCLPAGYAGKLRTAPVVLLYLSPGWNQLDVDEAADPKAQARYADRRTGNRLLDTTEHEPHYRWWSSRTKVFSLPEVVVREKVAILNLGAYHSKKFTASHGLAALPSCRVALDWAHAVLFPQAMDGERVVICMRAAANWGLKPGAVFGRSLFVPRTGRSGHMRKNEEADLVFRKRVAARVREAAV